MGLTCALELRQRKRIAHDVFFVQTVGEGKSVLLQKATPELPLFLDLMMVALIRMRLCCSHMA